MADVWLRVASFEELMIPFTIYGGCSYHGLSIILPQIPEELVAPTLQVDKGRNGLD
jgi:hypothetical protein